MGFSLEQHCQLEVLTRGVAPKLLARTVAWIRRLALGTQPVTARGTRAGCRKQRPTEALTANCLDSINISERSILHNNLVAVTREAEVKRAFPKVPHLHVRSACQASKCDQIRDLITDNILAIFCSQ